MRQGTPAQEKDTKRQDLSKRHPGYDVEFEQKRTCSSSEHIENESPQKHHRYKLTDSFHCQ